jgi:hypothetical protein
VRRVAGGHPRLPAPIGEPLAETLFGVRRAVLGDEKRQIAATGGRVDDPRELGMNRDAELAILLRHFAFWPLNAGSAIGHAGSGRVVGPNGEPQRTGERS